MERLVRLRMNCEDGPLRWYARTNVGRMIGIWCRDRKNAVLLSISVFIRLELSYAIDARRFPAGIVTLGGEIGGNEQALSPIEQPGNQPVVLTNCKPFNIFLRCIVDMRARFSHEGIK